MTDEEMAEERKADYGIDLCCLCRECETGNIYPCQHKIDAMHGYKDGFLAGLKAGRPQWHDLRKTPNDLPKARPLNWVFAVYDGGILWCRARREKCGNGVYWVNSYHHVIENVVMWAKIEIPTFDKE